MYVSSYLHLSKCIDSDHLCYIRCYIDGNNLKVKDANTLVQALLTAIVINDK